MKYILIILICFIGFATKAQVQKQPRSNFPTVVDSSLALGKNLIIPVFRSLSDLARYQVLDSSGRLMFLRDSNAVFYRTNAHTWAKLSSSGLNSVVWGNITGNINDQTDLIALTDTKVDYVFTVNGDSMYNHYSNGEVQFIGVFSTNTPNLLDGLISVQDITLVDTTVTIVPDIVYRRNNVNDTQSVGVVFEVNKADSGYSRFDLIYIDSLNVIRLIEGVQDTGVVIPPAMPPHGIQVTIISIVGDVVQQPVPSISTNYWSPNGNNITSGTAYLGTLNSKSLDLMTGGTVKATLDTIGQLRFPLLNNGNYPHALTFYNNADATVPSFNLAVNSGYGEITLRPTNSGFVNGFRIKKSADADSIIGGAYSSMYLQDYGKLKYNTTSSQTSAFEVTQANSPLFTVNSTTKPGVYIGSDTTYKPSSALTIPSTTQGILPPRMTTTQMNAINLPSNGLFLYNTTDSAYYYYKVNAWVKLSIGSGSATQDTLFVRTPLKVSAANDSLYMNQVSAFDSGWVSPAQAFIWDKVTTAVESIVAITDSSFENTHIDGSKDTVVIRGSGGGATTLQQAFDNAPTASPTINAHGNVFFIDSVSNFIASSSGYSSLNGAAIILEDADATLSATDGTNVQLVSATGSQVNINSRLLDNTDQHLLLVSPNKIQMYDGVDSSLTKVGIGTGFPLATTHIVGNGTDPVLLAMNGNVGIGTTTPSARVQIVAPDSNVLKLSGLINTVINTDSVLVIGTNGNVKKAVKPTSGGSGTVTSVATGYGLSGGTITSAGTLLVDSAALSLKYLRRADSVTNAGWTTLFQHNKTRDSLQTNINLKANIASPTFTGTVTIPNGAVLNTPASATLTNATGLPVSTGISGLATGIATWLATPSSANLLSALTTKTGTGNAMFSAGPVSTGLLTTDSILTQRLNLSGSNFTSKINLASTGSYTIANGLVWGANDVALYQTSQFGLGTNGSFAVTGALVANSSLTVSSGNTSVTSFRTAYAAKTTTYTIGANDYTINCTSGSFTVTLPTAVGVPGQVYEIVNSGAGTITIATNSSQTFANVTATPTTLSMTTVGTRVVKSNGANWLLISSL